MHLPLRSALLSAALLSLASGAGAQILSGLGATHIYGPLAGQVEARPSDAEVMAAWPAAAKARSLAGSAVMHCVAETDGTLSGCQIMLERSHAGFGQALLSLGPRFRMWPSAKERAAGAADVVISATWPAPETPVDWVQKPKPGDFSTTVTPAAWRAGSEGQAVMNCLTARMGSLHDCMVVYQAPAGKGFGAMALRFQGFLRLKPATLAGKPIESGLDVVFDFRPLRPGEVP
jgi:hypothetical protein